MRTRELEAYHIAETLASLTGMNRPVAYVRIGPSHIHDGYRAAYVRLSYNDTVKGINRIYRVCELDPPVHTDEGRRRPGYHYVSEGIGVKTLVAILPSLHAELYRKERIVPDLGEIIKLLATYHEL